MSKNKVPNQEIQKLFGKSSVTAVSFTMLLCVIIVFVISATPIANADVRQVSEPDIYSYETRIDAPNNEVDSFSWSESSDSMKADTYNDFAEEKQVETSFTFDSPEIITPAAEATAVEATAVADTGHVAVIVPETTVVPETATQVTSPAPETNPPPATVAAPETQPETKVNASEMLADKLGVVYTTSIPEFEISDYEIKIAAIIIQLEVMGDGSSLYKFDDVCKKYWEMLAVAECIRNRVESSYFPDTVEEVLLDSTTSNGKTYYQFSPASKIEKYTPTEEALIAAREVLEEGVTVLPDNYYYFCASNIESRFEKNNAYSLTKNDDGTYDKMRGLTSTFYAGFDQ